MAEKNKIHIPNELKRKVQHVCKYRPGSEGLYGADYIIADLKAFVKGPLRDILTGHEQKKALSKESLIENEKKLAHYQAMTISRATLQNAFGEKGVSANYFYYLEDLLREYVDAYIKDCPPLTITPGDGGDSGPVHIPGVTTGHCFSSSILAMIKAESGDFCMFQNCRIRTQISSLTEEGRIAGFGTANMIYGRRKGDPRYTPNPPFDTESHENGIWLCINHSVMVNAFNGANYKPEYLCSLKKTHRIFLNSMSEGKSGISKMGLNFSGNDKPMLNDILIHIEKQEYLFGIPDKKNYPKMRDQIHGFTNYLSDTLKKNILDLSVYALKELNGLNSIYKELLSNKELSGTYEDFSRSCAVIKKMTGLILSEIENKYKIKPFGRLLSIIPEIR